MVLNNFKEKLLGKSDMYNFYKNEYESKNQKKLDNIERLVNTHQDFLNNLFIFHEFEPTPYLKAMRTLSYEMLKFMDNVCKKYDLEWWVDYGTLLGAVRHRDFVPWDDDLDSGMMRKDYNKLIEVIPKEVKDNGLDKVVTEFKLDRGVNKTKRWFQIRYHYPGFRNTFTTLDVFPYDYVNDYRGQDFSEEFYDCIRKYYTYPTDYDMSVYMEEVFEKLNLTLEREDYLIAGVENVRGKVPKVTMYPHKVFDRSDIFPIKRLPFGDCEVPVPNETIKYVKDIYGNNYLRVPKKIRDHKRLNTFVKEENILEMLDEGITKLSRANENFE